MKKISCEKLAIIGAAAFVLALLPITGPITKQERAPSTISSFSINRTLAATTLEGDAGAPTAPGAPAPPIETTPTASGVTQTTAAGNTQATTPTSPQNPSSPIACNSDFATCAVYFISFFINTLMGWLIEVGATFAAAILLLNGFIYNSPAVLTGFSVTLAFANLGFILAIIIVAIATILQNQTYGVKKLLSKIVVMAILINFGLVVTRPITALSDSMSNYFIQQMGGNPAAMVTNITNSFAPQVLTSPPPANTSGATKGAILGGAAAFIACGAGGPVTILLCITGFVVGGSAVGQATLTNGEFNDAFLQMLIGMVFSAIFLSILAISFLTLAILLLIRYIYLTFLLILLPLAWLAWVFPGIDSYFKKWWHLFLRWTFFPAISLFFIYLALLIAPNSIGNQNNASYFTNAIGSPGVIGNQFGGGTSANVSLGAQLLIQITLCGLILGGLYAANSLGIAGAGVAIGYAQSAGTWVGKKAGGKARQGGKQVATRAVPQEAMEKLQKGELKGIARFIPKRLQVAAGIGLSNTQRAGGAALIDQESAWAKQHAANPEEAKRLLASGGLSERRQIALLQQLSSAGKLDDTVKLKDGQSLTDFADANNARLGTTLGQGKLLGDIDKALGSDKEMRVAARDKNQAKLDEEANKFYTTLTKSDIKSMNVNSVFGGDIKNPLAQAQLRAIANRGQDLMPSIMAKGNSKMKDNIETTYRGMLKEVVTKRVGDILASPEFTKQFQDVKDDYAGQGAAVETNADSLDAVKALNLEKGQSEAQLKRDQSVGFAPNLAAAQQKYDSTIKDIDARRKKIIADRTAELESQRDAKMESMRAKVEEDVEKRYGTKAFDRAIASATFSAAPENPTTPPPAAESPKAG